MEYLQFTAWKNMYHKLIRYVTLIGKQKTKPPLTKKRVPQPKKGGRKGKNCTIRMQGRRGGFSDLFCIYLQLVLELYRPYSARMIPENTHKLMGFYMEFYLYFSA